MIAVTTRRSCGRSPKSISICACCTSAPTVFMSCAPFSRPSRWPTRSRSNIEPARRTELTLDDNVDIPDNLVLRAARAALDAMRTHAHGPFPADETHPDGRRAGRRIEQRGGGAAGASGAGRAQIPLDRLLRSARNWAATCRFFLTGGTAVGDRPGHRILRPAGHRRGADSGGFARASCGHADRPIRRSAAV